MHDEGDAGGPRRIGNCTSYKFGSVLKNPDLRRPMGRTGICHDNAMTESFVAALKNDLVNRTVRPTKCATATATAETPPELPPGLRVYLALGDSVANGQQTLLTTGDYWTTVAGWRANGYVARFDTYLGTHLDCLPAATHQAQEGCPQLRLLNLARSAVPAMNGQPAKGGVTTGVLIDEQLASATAQLNARNHDRDPGNDVKVVTLTVGGNDVFGPITDACLAGQTPACTAAITEAFNGFAVNYDDSDPAARGCRARCRDRHDDLLQPAAVLQHRRREPGRSSSARGPHPRDCASAGIW